MYKIGDTLRYKIQQHLDFKIYGVVIFNKWYICPITQIQTADQQKGPGREKLIKCASASQSAPLLGKQQNPESCSMNLCVAKLTFLIDLLIDGYLLLITGVQNL